MSDDATPTTIEDGVAVQCAKWRERAEKAEAILSIPPHADRDQLGRVVREVWIEWAKDQPDPKPSWLVPYDGLSEADKEADRQIGVHLFRAGVNAVRAAHDEDTQAYRDERQRHLAELMVKDARIAELETKLAAAVESTALPDVSAEEAEAGGEWPPEGWCESVLRKFAALVTIREGEFVKGPDLFAVWHDKYCVTAPLTKMFAALRSALATLPQRPCDAARIDELKVLLEDSKTNERAWKACAK